MPSLRSRIFLTVLRNRHLLKFKLKKETAREWETSLPAVRASAAKTSRMFGKLPKGIQSAPIAIGELSAEWIAPIQADNDSVILYFHGGGTYSVPSRPTGGLSPSSSAGAAPVPCCSVIVWRRSTVFLPPSTMRLRLTVGCSRREFHQRKSSLRVIPPERVFVWRRCLPSATGAFRYRQLQWRFLPGPI